MSKAPIENTAYDDYNSGLQEGIRLGKAARDEELKEAVAAAEESALRRAVEACYEITEGPNLFATVVGKLIPEGNHLALYVMEQAMHYGAVERYVTERVTDKVAAAVLTEAEECWKQFVDLFHKEFESWMRDRLAANRVPGADPLARIREEARSEMREVAAHRVRLLIEHSKNCASSTDKDCDCSVSDVWRAVSALPVTASLPPPTSCAHAVVTSVDGVYVCAECGGVPNFIPSPGRASEETK